MKRLHQNIFEKLKDMQEDVTDYKKLLIKKKKTQNINTCKFFNNKISQVKIQKQQQQTEIEKTQQNNEYQFKKQGLSKSQKKRIKMRLKKNINLLKQGTINPQQLNQHNFYKVFTCQICFSNYSLKNKQKIGKNCEHYYCLTCLLDYINNSFTQQTPITCPSQNCQQLFDLQGKFFQKRNKKFKKQYLSHHKKMTVLSDPNLKFCPSPNCKDGVINLKENRQKPFCNSCRKEFCNKCWIKYHDGQCDPNMIMELKDNYRYKQCSRCFMLVQKNDGCDHMTCRCGYQFCYQCNFQWGTHDTKCVFYRNPDNQMNQMNVRLMRRRNRRFNPITEFNMLSFMNKIITTVIINIILGSIISIFWHFQQIWFLRLLILLIIGHSILLSFRSARTASLYCIVTILSSIFQLVLISYFNPITYFNLNKNICPIYQILLQGS